MQVDELKSADRDFTKVPNDIIRTNAICPTCKLILIALRSFAWGDDTVSRPSQERLAHYVGCDEQTIRRHFRQHLEPSGIARRIPRFVNGAAGRGTAYDLSGMLRYVAPPESLCPKDRARRDTIQRRPVSNPEDAADTVHQRPVSKAEHRSPTTGNEPDTVHQRTPKKIARPTKTNASKKTRDEGDLASCDQTPQAEPSASLALTSAEATPHGRRSLLTAITVEEMAQVEAASLADALRQASERALAVVQDGDGLAF